METDGAMKMESLRKMSRKHRGGARILNWTKMVQETLVINL